MKSQFVRGIFLTVIFVSVPAFAEMKVSEFDSLQSCLSGWMSKSETSGIDNFILRGNIFRLEHRAVSLACPNPRRNIVAWVEVNEKDGTETIKTLTESGGKIVGTAYTFASKSFENGTVIELEGIEEDCKTKIPTAKGIVDQMLKPKENVHLQISRVKAEFNEEQVKQWKLGSQKLYSLKSIEKNEKKVATGLIKKSDFPIDAEVIEETLSQLDHHWKRFEHRYGQTDPKVMAESLKPCHEYVDSVGQSLPFGKKGKAQDPYNSLTYSLHLAQEKLVYKSRSARPALDGKN